MYGTQDASAIWAKTWGSTLAASRYTLGKSNASLFYHPGHGSRGLVHGDDFIVLETAEDHAHFNKILQEKIEVRKTGEIGFEKGLARSLQILQRTVTVNPKGETEVAASP